MLALGRLLRLSLAPSALADVAAGTLLAAGAWPAGAAPWLGMLGSACVYHGGMALNDWADREEDARAVRPRPLPRGEIAAGTALGLAVGLLAVGPLLVGAQAPRAGWMLAGVALLAILYDLRGRGAWRGPLLLGACRAGNLTCGLLLGTELGGTALPGFALPAALTYGLYVFCLSRLARLEDQDPARVEAGRPGRWLGLAAALLLAHGAIVQVARTRAEAAPGALWLVLALAVAAWGALGLARTRPSGGAAASWGPADAGRAAGAGLRRLLVASSALVLQSPAPAAPWVALAILGGYPISFGLRRVFPPT